MIIEEPMTEYDVEIEERDKSILNEAIYFLQELQEEMSARNCDVLEFNEYKDVIGGIIELDNCIKTLENLKKVYKMY